MSAQINSKRIAKNTLYMYLRMFVIMAVTLYSARVVIRALGIDDYGIYNIVGGVVVLFSFVNISLRSAIQRFVSYELGQGNREAAHRIIGTSFIIVATFGLLFLVLAETVGLWFVENKLVIPSDKRNAALWVYQFSIITFVINLFHTPYQAIIISFEKMSFYAVYSIIEATLKLLVAFLLVTASSGRLVFYSALGCGVSIISIGVVAMYCHYKLKIPIQIQYSKKQFSDLFSYSGWSMANSSTVIVAQQGGNIILNMFVGVVANGAFGIANQVTAAINGFVSNFQSAFNPQIVKSYAAKEYDDLFKLINRTSLLSFCLLAIMAVPFFIESDYILGLWLGECPEYAAWFCNLMIIYFLIDAAQAPLWMLIHATGVVRAYQIWSGIITLMNLPIAAFLLKLGYSAYWVFIVRVFLNGIVAIIRTFYTHHLVKEFLISQYMKNSFVPILRVSVICLVIVLIGIFSKQFIPSFLIIILSTILNVILIVLLGIKQSERNLIINFIKNKFAGY